MSSTVSNVIANVSNVGGIMGLALQGVVGVAVVYKNTGSPHTTLKEAWETLLNIKARLDAVTPQRRQRIEAAAVRRQCRGLADIEAEFHKYVLFCIRHPFAPSEPHNN
jgi:hypothetical protein